MNKRFYLPLCFFGILLSVNICFAYYYDYEPNMLSKNLRLAAIGNLDLVIIERINEINAYDFGESPAGAISDNDGQSEISIPFLYGSTVFGDTRYNGAWHAIRGSISSIFRPGERIALGCSFSRARAFEESYSWFDGFLDTERDVMHYSLVTSWNIVSRMSIGFRGAYHKLTEEDSSFHGTYRGEAKVMIYEPSLLVNYKSGKWQWGLDYKYKRCSGRYGDTPIRECAIPVIHSSSNLKLGIRASLGTILDTAIIKSINVRSFHILPLGNKYLNLGFLLGYRSPHIMDGFHYGFTPGYQTSMGFGMAYLSEGFGLLGIQYKKEILTYTGFTSSYSNHKNCLGIGAEVYLSGTIPLRLGYTNIGWDDDYGYTSYHDVITWGIGFQFPNIDLNVDFCHNLYVYKRGYYGDETDYDHAFGLAGYFDF
jgi:hypothetical protein